MMKLAYMYATPDVAPARVTAVQDPIETAMKNIAETGYSGVELLVCDPARIDRRALAAAIRDQGLDMPAVCTGEVYGQDGLSFADPDPNRRTTAIDRMLASMDLASEYDAMVNVGRLRGRYVDGIAPQQTLDWIGAAIAQCAAAFPDVPIVLEPVNRNYANCLLTTGETCSFVRNLGVSSLGVMLDTAHILTEQETVADAIRVAGDLFWHFHITDSDRLPVGDGSYDIDAAMGAVIDSGFDRYVTVETFQIPDAGHAIAASFEAMQPYIPTRV
ncbi:sugar phosphate isomerase/epimerase family protein [Nitratireductor kimnyeongensis]|uniref:Sugar phosphate isomerase/epimerase family protein n=1 Tax=Nitratireductor kimnyeongensis TaxID=430679 RepID=A0ABW0T7Q1_9HYPH|nr:sugar phosphate isomerase/epimerase family protein [Nitratireductor kimnyeongensis]QZZ34375.1 sugar phosphate isomerase/epimerase [Nitratireductor kimnyeongensis]